jgi:hypothetical protein
MSHVKYVLLFIYRPIYVLLFVSCPVYYGPIYVLLCKKGQIYLCTPICGICTLDLFFLMFMHALNVNIVI